MELVLFHILLLLLLIMSRKSTSSQNSKYDECSKKFSCGDKVDLEYPFYDGSTQPDYCGYSGFKLDCSPDNPPKITISGQEYYLTNIYAADNYMITVSRNDTWQGECPDHLTNTTMDLSRFSIPPTSQVVTFFYDCKGYGNTNLSPLTLNTTCYGGGSGSFGGYYLTQDMLKANSNLKLSENCLNIFHLVSEGDAQDINDDPGNLETMTRAFKFGFDLHLIANNSACSSCIGSSGLCGYNFDSSKFACHCYDHDYSLKCGVGPPTEDKKGVKPRTILVIGLSTGFVVFLAVIGGCLLIFQKSKKNPESHSVENSLKNASLFPKRYSYKYIKRATNSFKEKLGEGGYGTVFKGSLKDGHFVAVKVWKQLKGDGHDFLNEVMSISRTSHINVVPLLGFCFEGHKRALIYEFMPNGSLEKFINGSHFNENNQPLSAQNLFEIGVGIARGLEYLHRGCNTRIVHFDIKPHNILLDAEFVPKISDFGLAKLCQQKESLLSMSEARGTIGYIAPEVFFRTYGGVSHKSDVYSFGMMILEMVGCKNKVHEYTENGSEMYFPQWIYKQLEQGAISINCERILSEEEKELERKMILVGLWCIQTNPVIRPSMSRVVEMLEGKMLLDVPPMPTLCTPPMQQLPDNESSSFLSSTTYTPTL